MAISVPIVSSFNPRGVQQASKSFEKFGKSVGRITKAAGLALAGVGVAAIAGAKSAIEAASNIGEATSKVNVVFGDAGQAVLDFSKTAASSFGLSQQAVLDAAGVFGTFGKVAGLAGTDLSTFSNDFTALAADLASFNNTTPEEAITALGAGLRGESEPLRRYGVLLDDATLKAKALELGIYDGTGTLTAQQKVLAAQASIIAQTTDAQGDFARTSGGLANQQRILKAQLANVTATIGAKLLPIALKIAQFVGDKVIPIFEHLSKVFSEEGLGGVLREVGGMIKKAIPPALAKIKELAVKLGNWLINTGWPWLTKKLAELGQALVDWIGPRIRPALQALERFISAGAQWLIDVGLPALVEKLKKLGDALVAWIKPQIKPAIVALGKLLVRIGKWLLTQAVPKLWVLGWKLSFALLGWVKELLPEVIAGLWEWIKGLGAWFRDTAIPEGRKWAKEMAVKMALELVAWFKDLPEKLEPYAIKFGDLGEKMGKALVNGIIGIWNKADLTFPRIEVPDWVPGIGGKGFGGFDIFPDLPMLANGGIVTGPTLAMIGEAGPEAVVPLDRLGGMGGGITINIGFAKDPVGTAREIRRMLNAEARRSGVGAII